jgi:hypothetical protein
VPSRPERIMLKLLTFLLSQLKLILDKTCAI